MITGIEEAARAVCNEAAQSVHRYALIAGASPHEHMPESFVVAFVFDRLGGEMPMTMETNLRWLWRWDRDHRDLPRSREEENSEVSTLVAKLGQRRADLVLYDGDPAKPSDAKFLALVEFKLWALSRPDREKIRSALEYIPTCPHGAICSIVRGSADAKRAELDGWFVQRVPDLPHRLDGEYFACISHFPR